MGRGILKDQPNRLPSSARHFAGASIIRTRPLRFKFNGHTVSAFEGDTVFSALIASGFDAVGTRDGFPLALSQRHAPPIWPFAQQRSPAQALPMERTPVTAGAHYVTWGAGGLSRVSAVVGRLKNVRSLGLDLDNAAVMQRPWLDGGTARSIATDAVIVGAGIAGMTAALALSKAGMQVTLVEARQQLGGHARLFGSQEGQETPDQSIARLVAAIAQDHTITVMLSTQAIAARPGAVRVHSVAVTKGEPVAETLDLRASRIVLATGVIERLPIFAGNRLPGVWPSLDAYDLAGQFGVWPGKTTLFATATSVAYRLAMLASDAGISVPRIMDARLDPQSRFVEFAKAYGITMANGTLAGEAKLATKDRQLSVLAQSSLHRSSQPETPLLADRLVLSGGWQPDLTLWHMAGGGSRWDPDSARLAPNLEGPRGIALAGSAAGYLSGHACLQSGKAAAAQLLGRRRITVEERLIDPIYETPDGPAPVAQPAQDSAAPAFLDSGQSYIERPAQEKSPWPAWVPFIKRPPAWSLADTPQPLALGDIAAGTQLGAIPPESAGIVAQERVALIAIEDEQPASPITAATDAAPAVPHYLGGRFGPDSVTHGLVPAEQRRLEIGALIYADADETDPFKAIGVVIRAGANGSEALLAAQALARKTAYVREGNRAFAVCFADTAGDLGPALGGGPSAP
jgi:sarcosine oxidase subunit alpha